jgi:hypothetical protein
MYAGSAAEVEVSQEQGEFVILETIIEENGDCDIITTDRDSKVKEDRSVEPAKIRRI